jgi:hypothetical protein
MTEMPIVALEVLQSEAEPRLKMEKPEAGPDASGAPVTYLSDDDDWRARLRTF